MDHIGAGEDAFFFQIVGLALQTVHVADAGHEGAHFVGLFVAFDELFHQRMFGGQGQEGHAEHGVGTGGEDFQMVDAVQGSGQAEAHGRTGGLADPVALHGEHAVGANA